MKTKPRNRENDMSYFARRIRDLSSHTLSLRHCLDFTTPAMRRLLFIAAFASVVVASSVFATQPTFLPEDNPAPEGKAWKPVVELSDDFDGNELDTSKWQSEPVGNGWGWIGRPPGLFRSENVSLKDGKMCVTVSKLGEPIVKGKSTFTHQGAIVRSIHPGKPGWYFECRMKANATVMSSTFWLMTKDGGKKRLELDIQECIGLTSELTPSWAKRWDQNFHSNMIDWSNGGRVQLQDSIPTPTKNHERFYVYGAWWKSPEEVRFYLDGKYAYTIKPKNAWDLPAFMHMAIETYDWNPIPEDGGRIDTGTWEQRTTQYDWIRTWQLVDQPNSDNVSQSAASPFDLPSLRSTLLPGG